MNSEERKNYNKTYYQTKRDQILKKACEKVECEFCHRIVIKNNILKHQKTKLCKNQEMLIIEKLKRKHNTEQIPNAEKIIELEIVEPVELVEPVEPVEHVQSNVKDLIKKFENKNI
jgi:hypothetical protein